MEEIFAEFIFAIYERMRKNEENTVFFFSFFHMEKIFKNWTRLKLSKMKNKIVKCNVQGAENCKNKFCLFFHK